jgi:hypothetical protein
MLSSSAGRRAVALDLHAVIGAGFGSIRPPPANSGD